MLRLKSQHILIAGHVVERNVYFPDERCGGMYMRYGKQWHQVGEVSHPNYSYYATHTLDTIEAALIEEQVDEAFNQGSKQASI